MTNIAQRFIPPVAGLDLEQSLNYVLEDGLELDWFYQNYTYPRVFYSKGSKPVLEAFLKSKQVDLYPSKPVLARLLQEVYKVVHHYCLLGVAGPADLGLSEEAILDRGKGWCNEQARLLIVLAQIIGYPSRLVFASMPDKRGHVLCEVFVDGRWALVDQTAAHLFLDEEGNTLNVSNLRRMNEGTAFAREQYRKSLQIERNKSVDPVFFDKIVPYGSIDDPLQLFHKVGYLNYFVH